MFATLPASVNYLLAALVWPASPPVSPPPQLNFHLRHAHAIASNSSGRVIFQDIDHAFAAQSSRQSGYRVSTSTVQTHRPHSFEAHVKARLRSLYNSESLPPDALWYKEDTSSPNVTDLDTIITLAEMTSNSYFKPTDSSWYDMGPDWNANAVRALLRTHGAGCSNVTLELSFRLGTWHIRHSRACLCFHG